jgi:hypothetical protein
MSRYWVTTGSINPEAVVNPLAAACTEWDYVPERIYLLENPGVEDELGYLLYFLAVRFGVIQLPGVTMYGV